MGRRRQHLLIPISKALARDPSASSVNVLASLSTEIQTALVPDWGPESLKRQYAAAVLARYVWLPDTPTTTSRRDHRLARHLYDEGVPLAVVEAALLLAGARRALRAASTPLPPVRALHY